jgi:hypothetical protein
MNVKDIVPWLPVVGGSLAVIGAIISFVNSRLNEAKTEESRAFIVYLTLNIIALACSLSGLTGAITIDMYITSAILFTISFAIQTIIFFSYPGNATRVIVFNFSLACSLFTMNISSLMVFHITTAMVSFDRETVGLLDKQEALISNLVDVIKKSPH